MLRNYGLASAGLLIFLGGFGLLPAIGPAMPSGVQTQASVETPPAATNTPSDLVLLDVVATDKKGNYLEGLGKQDFRVFEDGKEQPIDAFSLQPEARPSVTRYMVLFFDDSTLSPTAQLWARQQAAQFVEGAALPERQMAVVDFGGSLRVAQMFTSDGALLKRAVSAVQYSRVNSNAGNYGVPLTARGAPALSQVESEVGSLRMLQSIQEVANRLRGLKGRKTMILFSSGFLLRPEWQRDLNFTVDALIRANIAVYPVENPTYGPGTATDIDQESLPQQAGQRNRSSNPGGGLAPGREGSDQSSPTAISQPVLHAMAKGTGGFEIVTANNILDGLQKVAKETNEYYELGYAPAPVQGGSYHKIKIDPKRSGVNLRYRAGYFAAQSSDLLKGTPEGKALEERLASPAPGEIPLAVSTPYFYVKPGVARVIRAVSIPGSEVPLTKRKSELHSDVNVLGITYKLDGSVAARFSDIIEVKSENEHGKDFGKVPIYYRKTFDIAPGSYTLALGLSAGGEKFAKYNTPFYVQPFSGDKLSLTGPALGEKFTPIAQLSAQIDAASLEGNTTLVFRGKELIPSPTCHFAHGTEPAVYVEVYDPALKGTDIPKVAVAVKVFDQSSDKPLYASSPMVINSLVVAGNPLVPVGFNLPVGQSSPGNYRIEITALDSLGGVSSMRAADFSIE